MYYTTTSQRALMKEREKQQKKETTMKGREDEKMFLVKFSFALLYIAINVMMVVIVFRYEDVSKAIMIAMTTVSSTMPAMPTMKMPSIPLPKPTGPTLRQEFGTGAVIVDALSFQVVTHPYHRSSRSQQQPPSMSPSSSLKRTAGLFQGFEDNNNEDFETFFEYNNNDDKKLVEDLRRQFFVQKMMEKEQQKNSISTPSSSASSTSSSSSVMKMKSNDGDSDAIDGLLYKYGTSSPIFRILPNGMKEAANRLVSKMLSTISTRPASTTAQHHKHA